MDLLILLFLIMLTSKDRAKICFSNQDREARGRRPEEDILVGMMSEEGKRMDGEGKYEGPSECCRF